VRFGTGIAIGLFRRSDKWFRVLIVAEVAAAFRVMFELTPVS